MKACLFLAFFLVQLLSLKPVVSSPILDKICSNLGDSYADVPCFRMIVPDPRSESVKDIRDVALLAADISIEKAVVLQSYAKKLLENTTDADTKVRAEGANRILTDAITDLKFVKESLIANLIPGANAAALVAKYSEVTASSFIGLVTFKNEYSDVSLVLSALILHMV